ncbi:MAG TPA: hypothetical protein VIY72_02520, partial [Acidimicrobiales bacterium]
GRSAADPAAVRLRAAGASFVAASPTPSSPPDPGDAAMAAWTGLGPDAALEPSELDAVADLTTLGHRGDDLAALSTATRQHPDAD